MLLVVSVTPCCDVRFVFPSGPPGATMDALCAFIQSPHALSPEFVRSLRVASSSLSQFDRSRADAEPMYMARKVFIRGSIGARAHQMAPISDEAGASKSTSAVKKKSHLRWTRNGPPGKVASCNQ